MCILMSDDYRQTLYRKIINATRRDFNNGNGSSVVGLSHQRVLMSSNSRCR